jgi:hypothetical protein
MAGPVTCAISPEALRATRSSAPQAQLWHHGGLLAAGGEAGPGLAALDIPA